MKSTISSGLCTSFSTQRLVTGKRSRLAREAGAGSVVVVVGGGGCIVRAPGGSVELDRDALRVGSRVDQVERDVRAGVGEQPPALAEDGGDDQQGELVDEV